MDDVSAAVSDLAGLVFEANVSERDVPPLTELCLEFLRDAKADGRPFFLWIHYWDPHDPIVMPPKEFLSHIQNPEAGTAAASAVYEQVYAAEVRYMDRQIAALIEGLEERGLWENMIVAVTADHGEGLADGYPLIQIPQNHGSSSSRRGQDFAIRTEDDAFYITLIPLEGLADRFASIHIPQNHGIV